MSSDIRPAYFNQQALKDELVKRAETHLDLGTITQRTYGKWEVVKPGTAEFRGCAIGCLTQPIKYVKITNGFISDDDAAYWAEEHNIPTGADDTDIYDSSADKLYSTLVEDYNFSKSLCVIIESIFETLDPKDAQYWPLDVVSAIIPGSDISDQYIQSVLGDSYQLCLALEHGEDILGSHLEEVIDFDFTQGAENWDDYSAKAAREELLYALS